MAPNEACPECGAMGYRMVYRDATSFRCNNCGFHEPPHIVKGSWGQPTEGELNQEEAELHRRASMEDD